MHAKSEETTTQRRAGSESGLLERSVKGSSVRTTMMMHERKRKKTTRRTKATTRNQTVLWRDLARDHVRKLSSLMTRVGHQRQRQRQRQKWQTMPTSCAVQNSCSSFAQVLGVTRPTRQPSGASAGNNRGPVRQRARHRRRCAEIPILVSVSQRGRVTPERHDRQRLMRDT